MLQFKCDTQEDFFEMNIIRLRKTEISWIFVAISQMSDQSISQRAFYLLNLRSHWLLKIKLKHNMTWSLFKNIYLPYELCKES